MDELLQSLGCHLYVSFQAEAISSFVGSVTLPSGGTVETAVFRGNLFYPNGECGGETHFTSVYVNVPRCNRVNGVLQKGLCEVYRVSLSDLVSPATVAAEKRPVSEILWVGI
eukprot:1848073-Rhodomonas_salina.1